jgi:hypothetical protein
MLLLPAGCLPPDLVNPFTGFAVIATTFAVGSIIGTLMLLFVPRMFERRATFKCTAMRGVVRALPIVGAIGACVTLGIATWLWMQSFTSVAFCASVPLSILDAERQRVNMAFLLALIAAGLSLIEIFVIGGILLAAVVDQQSGSDKFPH